MWNNFTSLKLRLCHWHIISCVINDFSYVLFAAKEKDSRRNKSYSSKDGNDESDSSRCVLEFKANESRSGMINSNNLPKLKNRACTIIFRGNPGDVLQLHLESYKLR